MTDLSANRVGLKDQPISSKEEEALGLGEYAEVLTEFIQRCDTPMTIALQGDWGSGKTSLMTLIQNELNGQGNCYRTVWFNTWQYAQFNMADTLALSMMSRIGDGLRQGKGSETVEKLKRSLWAATRTVAVTGAAFVGQSDTMKEGLNELEQARSPESSTDDAALELERIKENLAKVVNEACEGETEKVVVFIDDLDRLVPERAVDLLEALKIFLDIDRCVFVIACDYSVVAAGLKQKFGLSEGELKGKSFFDKIIQVPFKMPTRRYQIDTYIKQLLKQIGLDFGSTRTEIYRELVEHSVGFNPRTMKRLLNTLQLLTILEDRRRRNSAAHDGDDGERRRHAARVTFGILCMMEAWEPIYDHLTEEVTEERILGLKDGLANGGSLAELRRKIGGEDSDARKMESARRFVETFVECLQLDDDKNLSHDEIRHLGEMLSLAALVSSGRKAEDFVPREFAVNLRWELNDRYSSFVNSKRPKYDKFRMEQGVVYLWLPGERAWLSMGRGDDSFYFDLRSNEEQLAYDIGRRICKELLWESAVEFEDYGYVYRFFEQPADGTQAEEKYRTELFRRLDELTAKPSQLYAWLKETTGL